MHRHVFISMIVFIGGAAALLCGCQMPVQQQATLTSATPEPVAVAPARPPGPLASSMNAFGERGRDADEPFDSRMVVNYRQHSFTMDGLDFDPDVDPKGTFLVYASTRNAQHPDLYWKAVDGTATTQLTGDPADDIQPSISPDGERIAFCSNRTGNWDVWLIRRDGTGLVQLTHDPGDEVAPCWSPDGRQLAYSVWGYRSHQWEIWMLDVERPGMRKYLANGMFPAWSPDGRHISFQRARQRGSQWFSIWTLELVDGEARHPTEVVHSEASACVAPRWSPDGSKLVYCALAPSRSGTATERESTVADLWSIELATGARVKLTDGSVSAFNPVWAPNGRIFFVCARGGTENIWSVVSGPTGPEIAATSEEKTPPAEQGPEKTPSRSSGDTW